MADDNELRKRVEKLEKELEESRQDRSLIKQLIILLVDSWDASHGQTKKAYKKIRNLLGGNREQE